MKKSASAVLMAAGWMLAVSQGAQASAMSISVCPGDTRNTPQAFIVNELKVDDVTVNSVPVGDSSTHMNLIWAANGQIWLVVSDGSRWLIGTAKRPARTSHCDDFAVEINPQLQYETRRGHGLPHVSGNPNHQGVLSRPVVDELELTIDGGESVTIEGFWKEIKVDGHWVRL